jgi:hypothetical protein
MKISSKQKKWQTDCGQPSEDGEPAKEDAGGHNWSNLRLKNDLLAMVKGANLVTILWLLMPSEQPAHVISAPPPSPAQPLLGAAKTPSP